MGNSDNRQTSSDPTGVLDEDEDDDDDDYSIPDPEALKEKENFDREVAKVMEMREKIKKKKEAIGELLAEEDEKIKIRKNLREKAYMVIDSEKNQSRLVRFIKRKTRSMTPEEKKLLAKEKELEKNLRRRREELDNLKRETFEYRVKKCEIGIESVDFALTAFDIVGGVVAASNARGMLASNINKSAVETIANYETREAVRSSVNLSLNLAEKALLSVVSIVAGGIRSGISGVKKGEAFTARGKLVGFIKGLTKGMKAVAISIFNPKTIFVRNLRENLTNTKNKINSDKRALEEKAKKIEDAIRVIRMSREPEVVKAEDEEKIAKDKEERDKKRTAFNEKRDALARLKAKLESDEKTLDDNRLEEKKLAREIKHDRALKISSGEKKSRKGVKKRLGDKIAKDFKRFKRDQKEFKKMDRELKEALGRDPSLEEEEPATEDERKMLEEKKKKKVEVEFRREVSKIIEIEIEIEKHQGELRELLDEEKKKKAMKSKPDSDELRRKIKGKKNLIEELKMDTLEYKIRECDIARQSAKASRIAFSQASGIISTVLNNVNSIVLRLIPPIPFIAKAFDVIAGGGSFISGIVAAIVAAGVAGAKEKEHRLRGIVRGIGKGFITVLKGIVEPSVQFASQVARLNMLEREQENLKKHYEKIAIGVANERKKRNRQKNINTAKPGDQGNMTQPLTGGEGGASGGQTVVEVKQEAEMVSPENPSQTSGEQMEDGKTTGETMEKPLEDIVATAEVVKAMEDKLKETSANVETMALENESGDGSGIREEAEGAEGKSEEGKTSEDQTEVGLTEDSAGDAGTVPSIPDSPGQSTDEKEFVSTRNKNNLNNFENKKTEQQKRQEIISKGRKDGSHAANMLSESSSQEFPGYGP
ncbi:MAG: hypothetical protein LBB24_02935 [Rickettsiales bacterium]|jgi:hypothetical protein|nr:hypothetical protein [Rickettsiales bacterium]